MTEFVRGQPAYVLPPPSIAPRKYRLTDKCVWQCSLNERNLPAGVAPVVHTWIEEGRNHAYVAAAMADRGWPKFSKSAFHNHKSKHLIPEDQVEVIAGDPASSGENVLPPTPLSDIQILERIVAAGATQLSSRTTKISPEMTMRAIEMKYRLTQGNVMDSFLQAVDAAMGGDDDEIDDGDPAVRDVDEAKQATELHP